MDVRTVIVPPHEHLSLTAATRTISGFVYMGVLFRGVKEGNDNDRDGLDYSATVRTVMVPPQEHLSEEAATRTIWALTYMVNLFGLGLGLCSETPRSASQASHAFYREIKHTHLGFFRQCVAMAIRAEGRTGFVKSVGDETSQEALVGSQSPSSWN